MLCHCDKLVRIRYNISPIASFPAHIQGRGDEKRAGGDAKLMKRNKKQMLGLYRKSMRMAQLIWLVGL